MREKDLSTRDLVALATDIRSLTRRYDAALLINDRIDVAIAVDADGVHLPASSFTVEDARHLLGPERIIGVSTHSREEVAAAGKTSADFIVFGPVFDTPSKRQFGAPTGLEGLPDAAQSTDRPVIAIGGITPDRIEEVLASGVGGVAVIRAILGADDPEETARRCLIGLRRGAPALGESLEGAHEDR